MPKRHILIVNQHGDNRGDEAAMRAMVHALRDRLGDVRFTIVHQFRDRGLRPRLEAEVEWHSLILSIPQGFALLAAGLLRPLGLGRRPRGSGTVARLRAAYESADLVISAPGGPYFGDIYASHEIVHWFYVWLAGRYRRQCFLYAPSAGPFRHRLLNPVRRRLFPRFAAICVREEISAEMLRAFLPGIEVEVTADSALQRVASASPLAPIGQDFVLGLSARAHGFPNARDAAERQALQVRYLSVLEDAVRHLAGHGARRAVLFPQLYGAVHSDVPFLREIGTRIGDALAWEIFDAGADSDRQRDAIGQCDVFLASRYHPQIFAAEAGVPGLCFAYEHKMTGFMTQLGLARFALPIDALDADEVRARLDEVLADRARLSAQLIDGAARLHRVACRTTDRAVALLERGG